jgi:hypothetical protein
MCRPDILPCRDEKNRGVRRQRACIPRKQVPVQGDEIRNGQRREEPLGAGGRRLGSAQGHACMRAPVPATTLVRGFVHPRRGVAAMAGCTVRARRCHGASPLQR